MRCETPSKSRVKPGEQAGHPEVSRCASVAVSTVSGDTSTDTVASATMSGTATRPTAASVSVEATSALVRRLASDGGVVTSGRACARGMRAWGARLAQVTARDACVTTVAEIRRHVLAGVAGRSGVVRSHEGPVLVVAVSRGWKAHDQGRAHHWLSATTPCVRVGDRVHGRGSTPPRSPVGGPPGAMTRAMTGLTLDEVMCPQDDAGPIPPKLGIPLSRKPHQPHTGTAVGCHPNGGQDARRASLQSRSAGIPTALHAS